MAGSSVSEKSTLLVPSFPPDLRGRFADQRVCLPQSDMRVTCCRCSFDDIEVLPCLELT